MSMMKRLLLCGLLLGALPALSFAQGGVVEYYHLDALGTVRAVTSEAGAVLETHNYLPFGEELCPSGGTFGVCGTAPAGQPKRFTGKERDTETGLDYFGVRYFRSNVGRFTTIDPVYTWQENLEDPQRWNRYAYVRNNPLKYVDPDGRVIETAWDAASVAIGVASLRGNLKDGNWGSALLDALGVAYDGFAAAIPVLPGGVGAGIKAVRGVDKVRDAVRAGGKATDVTKSVIGGGKTARKINPDRAASARSKVDELRERLDGLKSHANKTKDTKAEIERVQGQLRRETDRMRKSEEHARQAQR